MWEHAQPIQFPGEEKSSDLLTADYTDGTDINPVFMNADSYELNNLAGQETARHELRSMLERLRKELR